ncbi:TIGR03503 family protein [Thalassotalea sp. G2M2-11]|uniref:TIGR03503 family protein n=1 Tax=Thalassotalea sp. G2M2-11 TaxID=2787627 RepID=UPI0019D23239|nr:TIGR03503 family protein [Thalassotalea sp. G2M2-11]
MAKLRLLSLLLISVFAFSNESYAYSETPKVKYYDQDDITNQIPFFDNRFHIDAQLEEVTLVFYRNRGSQPVILVRPDGSKLKINTVPKDKVKWFDDQTFDMIQIKRPMPGPWQAVGDILPNSKIMLVTDVRLEVEPLAEILLSGETLKVEAQIYNSEKVIDDPLFNDVIELDIDFYSTNNSSYDNFGAEPIDIGAFRDDGYDLDEYARDSLFTAEFTLDFAPGEWIPIYRVKMPMATRELRQKPVIVHSNPVSLVIETSKDGESEHRLLINIDDSYVDADSLIFQGKVTFPDRQSEPFAIMEGKGKQRIKMIRYTEGGIHRIRLNAFGKTKNGREFRLVVPDFTFNVERVDGPLVPTLDGENQETKESEAMLAAKKRAEEIAQEKAKFEMQLAQAKAEQEAIAQAEQQQTLIMIAIANGIIVLFGIGMFIYLRRKN